MSTQPSVIHVTGKIKKRVLLSSLFVVLSCAVLLHAAVRGTRASSTPVDPQKPTDGVVCGLQLQADGSKPVRCAMLVDAPIDAAWAVITDYPHYTEIFPYLSAVQFTRESDGSDRMIGVASTSLYRDWHFDLHLSYKSDPENRISSWDEPGGKLTTNRGHWTVHRVSPTQTLVSYTLEITVRHIPHFFLRNVLLDHIPAVLQAVHKRLGHT